MDKLQTRNAINTAFFEVMNDIRWYLRRGGKNLDIIFDDWLKLLAPFIPHLCEEIWHRKHDTFISLEKYPEFDESKIDEAVEKEEEYLKMLIDDINEVKKFVKDGSTVYIALAEDWKNDVVAAVMENKNMKEVMKTLMKDERLRKIAKEVQSFVKRVFKEKIEFTDINEFEVINENREFIEQETSLKVVVDPEKVPEEKRRASMPGKPAIYVV